MRALGNHPRNFFAITMSYDFYLRQIVRGDTKPLHIDLNKVPITLCRKKYTELKDYPKVSRAHASIEFQEGQWFVKDLNSFYGTFVNGFRIGTNRYPLQIGDQIGLGSIEDGFICALSVTPVKIKKEPVESVDISDDSSSIKDKPKDDYKIWDSPPTKTTDILKTDSGVSPCNKFQHKLKESIKTEPPDKPQDSVKIINQLVDCEEGQSSPNTSGFSAAFNLHKNSTNTINSYSLCSKESFNDIYHTKLTKHMNSTTYSNKSLPYKLKLAKKRFDSKNSIDLNLSTKGHEIINVGDKGNNKPVIPFLKGYKVIDRKRVHVNSVKDDELNPYEVNSSHKENLKIRANVTEIRELNVSKPLDWCKTSKRKRLYLDPEKDTFKKSQKNILPKCYNSGVYSSDLSTLLQDNSYSSPSIEDHFETNAMHIDDILDCSQKKLVWVNTNPKISNDKNIENMPSTDVVEFRQKIRDKQASDIRNLNFNEGMCENLQFQMSSIPEENKICTNFFTSLASANQQKFIAESRADDGFDTNELGDYLTSSLNENAIILSEIESVHLQKPNSLLTESQDIGYKDKDFNFHVENDPEKGFSQVHKAFDGSSPVQATKNSDLALADIRNSRTANNLTLISSEVAKNSFHMKTLSSTDITSSIKKSVLRGITSMAVRPTAEDGLKISESEACVASTSAKSESGSASVSSLGEESTLYTSALQAVISSAAEFTAFNSSFGTSITSRNKTTFLPLTTEIFSVVNSDVSLPTRPETVNVSIDCNWLPLHGNEKNVIHVNRLQASEDNSCIVTTSILDTMPQITPMSSTSQVSPITTSMLKNIISSISQSSSILSSVQNTSSNSEIWCDQNTVTPIINSNLPLNSDFPLQEASVNKSLETKFSSSLEPSTASDGLQDSKWLNRWIPVSPTTNNSPPAARLTKDRSVSCATAASFLKPELSTVSTMISQPLLYNSSLHKKGKLLHGENILTSKECASSVSQNSKSLNIWTSVSSYEEKALHAMSCVTSSAILNSEATAIPTATRPSLQPDSPVLEINNEILQGENIFMPDEYISQDNKWINNWVSVPPTEENTSCIKRSSMVDHNLDIAPTSVLKLESEEPVVSTSGELCLVSDLQLKNKFHETDISTYLELPVVTSEMHDSKWLNDWISVSSTEDHALSLKEDNSDNDSVMFDEFASETPPDIPMFTADQRKSISPHHELAMAESQNSKRLNSRNSVTSIKENAFLDNKVPTNTSSEISYGTVSESVLQTIPMSSVGKQISMTNCNISPSPTYADCLVRIPSRTVNIVKPIFSSTNQLVDQGEFKNLASSNQNSLKIWRHNQKSISQKADDYSKQARLNIIKNLVEFDVKCLKETKSDVQPPFLKLNSVAYLPLHFSSFDHYSSSFVPLLMLEVWKNVHQESKRIWEDKYNIFNLFYFSVFSFESNSYMDELHCEALVNELFFPPAEGCAVILKIRLQNNTYYNGCCYIYKHSVTKIQRESFGPQWKKFIDGNLENLKLWKFSVFVKPQASPPVLHQLMKGNGICSVQKYLRLADGLEYLKSSPLCENILEPKPNVFLKPSRSTLKLTHAEALAAISKDILGAPTKPKIVLLQGAPGTGKTRMIVNLIEELIAEDSKSKILVTAPTDATLDIIAHRLITSKLQRFFIRLGETQNIDKNIIPFSLNTKAAAKYQQFLKVKRKFFSKVVSLEQKLAKRKLFRERCNSGKISNSSELKCKIHVLKNTSIVLSTLEECTSLESLTFTAHDSPSMFSCCIMDDVTQCPELEVLQSLIVSANQLILIGDLQQVPPEGYSSLAVSYGFNRSLFARFSNYFFRLQQKELILELKEQFRMHSEIWHFPSNKFYSNSSLIMQYPNSQNSQVFQQPYRVYDTLGNEFNFVYDQAIALICFRLRAIKKTAASIGIIIPSKNLQSYYSEHILKNEVAYNHIEIDTIDAFRGREKDFIILSCDKRKLSDNSSFLSCSRTMTVALTRARKCLIICMCSNTLRHVAHWQDLIADAKARSRYKVLHSVTAIPSAIQKIINK